MRRLQLYAVQCISLGLHVEIKSIESTTKAEQSSCMFLKLESQQNMSTSGTQSRDVSSHDAGQGRLAAARLQTGKDAKQQRQHRLTLVAPEVAAALVPDLDGTENTAQVIALCSGFDMCAVCCTASFQQLTVKLSLEKLCLPEICK